MHRDVVTRLYRLSALILVSIIVVMFGWHWLMRETSLDQLARRTPRWLKIAAVALMLITIVLVPIEERAFIYFQF